MECIEATDSNSASRLEIGPLLSKLLEFMLTVSFTSRHHWF